MGADSNMRKMVFGFDRNLEKASIYDVIPDATM